MPDEFAASRRSLIAAAFGVGAAAAMTTAAAAASKEILPNPPIDFPQDLIPNSEADQSAALQAAIDRAAETDAPLTLAPGSYRVSDIRLRAGTRLIGPARTATLVFAGGAAFVTADKADGLVLRGIVFDGQWKAFEDGRGEGLVSISRSEGVVIDDVEIRHSAQIGLSLIACSGRIANTLITGVLGAGVKALDSAGLDIRNNVVTACGDNGVLVWRSEKGEDATTIVGNRISHIRNASGGSGEYGNGINVFRAGSVMVANNRVSDCAYTAIRGNAADNIQIVANSCERLGEVAIYAEFGFEGALIANNVVDGAATGISVTNFNEGGRLAVIQGNLIRNLFRREREAVDKRGEGIGVEADAVVSGNTIEGAPTVGIQIGWGAYMRDVAVTGNVVRRSKVGVAVTADAAGGACLVANNVISSAEDGAIRQMRLGAVFGPDLAREPAALHGLTISGNVAV